MGGGDLNLKKSWHPSTRANLERVYLAEVEAQKERKKFEELQKEKRRERELNEIRKLKEAAGVQVKQTERLEWMYASSYSRNSVPSESAKILESKTVQAEDKIPVPEKKLAVTSKRWDVEAKIREDPLTKISKRRKN